MADQDLYYFKDFTKDERDKLAESGAAMPDGSYPIQTAKDLTNAVSAYGHNATPAVKAHIVKRAKSLGKTDLLPVDWEGSTKQAGEPGASDVHVPAPPQPKTKKDGPGTHFLKKLYKLMGEKVGKVLSPEDFNSAVRQARGHAGGKTRADNRTAQQMSELSYGQMIEMVNAELREEYANNPFASPFQTQNWYAQEVYPDYVIVKDTSEGCYYQISYTLTADDEDIELGEPVEVEQTFVPKAATEASDNILDLCAYGHTFKEGIGDIETEPNLGLFNELQQYTATPDRMPLLPKPGTYTHEKYGKVKITKERNQRFCDNINNAIYQSNLPIDAEHELDLSGAFGYIKKASMNQDGSVDATDVEWNDRGKKAFDDNRFKYFSPKWWDKWTDPMTEKKYSDVVIGGALTTRPFFKEKALKPLIASERGIFVQDEDGFAGISDDRGTIILQFTALAPDKTGDDMATQAQIESARRLVAAADAKAMREALQDKTEDDIKAARALVASEDARIASVKKEPADEFATKMTASDPDGDGDDDTSAEGDSDNSHFDKGGKKKPEMFDKDGKPMAKAATETVPQAFAERLNTAEQQAKQFKEELDATKAEAKKANDRADAMDKANRIMRFTGMVRDWPGDNETNINLLEHFATSCDGGEQSKEFKDFVTVQSASATQLKDAGLFNELGSSLGGAPDSPLAELNVKAGEIMQANPGKFSEAQAFNEALNRNPKLYDAYRASERKSVN